MELNDELIEKIKKCNDKEELDKLLKENNIDFNDISSFLNLLATKELSEEEINKFLSLFMK